MCWDSSPFCRWLIHWEPVMSYGLWSFSSGSNTRITIPPHTFSSLSLFLLHACPRTHTHTQTRMHIHFLPKISEEFTKFLTPYLEYRLCSLYPQWCDGVLDLQLSHLWKCVSDIMSPSLQSFVSSLPQYSWSKHLPFSLYSCWLTASGHIQIQSHLKPGSYATIFGKPLPNQRELNFSFCYLLDLF